MKVRFLCFVCILSLFSSFPIAAHAEGNDSVFIKEIASEGVDFTHNNRLVFFHTGADKFKDLFQAVRQAKSSIHMEYFNFRDDSIANRLFDLLALKVKEGVKVRLIFDGFGNDSNNKPLKKKKLKEIRSRGIEIKEFDPIVFPWVNHIIPRDHRKIVVIDGKTAYSGGMNVADYYIKGKKEFGAWHDIHYRIEGDAVGTYQSIFLRMWNRITHQHVAGAEYYPGESLPQNALKGLLADSSSSSGHKTIGIINREPHTSPAIIRQTFVYAINSAHKLIQIINPYFTLNASIRRALRDAIHRGVEVEIMVSEKCDIPITPRIVDYNVRQLMKCGAKVYYFQGGFHHSKIMMVDSRFCFVGSANLDSRSLYCDYECNALIMDADATRQLQTIFNRDKTQYCVPLTDAYWKSRPGMRNFASWLYHFLGPVVYHEEKNKATQSNERLFV